LPWKLALRLVGETGEKDAAAGVDVVERIRGAAAHIEGAETAGGIGAELHAVDPGTAGAGGNVEVGAQIAGDKTGAQGVAEACIDAGEEAAEPARQRRRIAVAVGAAPAAETERPEGEIAPCTVRAGRTLHRQAGVGGGRVGQLRPAERKRTHVPGNAGIGDLPHAAEHAAAGELRLRGLRRVHAAEDLAGQRIERPPGAFGGLIEDTNDKGIGNCAAVEGCRNYRLIARLRHGSKPEATAGTATSATTTTTASAATAAISFELQE
jgi:hypothetical protein